MSRILPQAVAAPRTLLADTPSHIVRGIAFATLAYFIWTLGDATAKWSLPAASVAGAMLWRGVFGAATVVAVTLGHGEGWRRIKPVRWRLVLARSLLSSFVSVTWYVSWLSMSLADTYAVGFTAPLIMTVLAVIMLGERIRWRRALSTLLGFGGVLIMLRPGGDLWTPVVVLLLAGTAVMALTRIMTRQLTATETPECQAFWLLICHMLTGLAMLPWLPMAGPLTPMVWLGLAFLGVSSGLAHCIFASGYALAPVSALAPYEYTMMPFAVVFGYLLFGDTPSWSTLLGFAVVAGTGSYNAYRESRLRQG